MLELCAASLDRLFLPDNDVKKYRGPVPDDLEMMRQIANGLAYIHSQNFMHRDIKPLNILISENNPVTMKVADFGGVKKTENAESASWSGECGTLKWASPELIQLFNEYFETDMMSGPVTSPTQERISKKTDVFSTGLVFFFILTKGEHPFGYGLMVTSNILEGKPEKFDGNCFSMIMSSC